MRLTGIIKMASLLLLALTGREASAACVKSKVKGIDYLCGEEEPTFQPCSDFELIAGRATRSTTMWLFGEIHNHKDRTIQCIEKLTKNRGKGKQIVYLEGIEAGAVVDCEEIGFKKNPNRTCMGMEDMQAYGELQAVYSTTTNGFEIPIIQECFTQLHQLHRKKSDKVILAELKKMKKEYEETKRVHEKAHQPLPEKYHFPEMLKALDWLLTEHQQGSSFSDLFEKKRHRYGEGLGAMVSAEEVRAINHKRNVAEMTLLATHPEDTLGLICNGIFHVVPNNQYDMFDSEYLNSAMANGPHKDSYATLTMKGR